MKQKLKKLLLDNWGLKLISLVLAFVLWFMVISIDDPVREKSFANIKVNLINTEELEAKGMVWEILDETDVIKTVSFDAPLSVRETIEASDIIAQADLGEITVAETVAIEFLCPKYSNQVTNISGSITNVKLRVEEKVSKWINIEYKLVGDVAEGYLVGGVSLEQNRLEIAGPQSKINEVTKAVVYVDVAGAKAGELSARVDVHLLDATGKEVSYPNVTKNTDAIKVTVDVHTTKEVPIEYSVSGVPAEGYLLNGIVTVSPDRVVVAGPGTTLNKINKVSIPLKELDVTGATGNVEKIIDLKNYLANNVYFGEADFDGKVTVIIEVEPVAEKKIALVKDNITLTNIPEGYVAQFPDNISMPAVTLSGLKAELDVAGGITGTVDVTEWFESLEADSLPLGIHALPVELIVPEQFKQVGEVTVNIEFAVEPVDDTAENQLQ